MNNTKHPWLMLASIYIAQYIAFAFILSGAVSILRQQGLPLDKLALLNLAILPMVGKIFYAPLIDKYRPLLQGKYRSWLIVSNAAMVLLLCVIGILDLSLQFSWILFIVALYVFFVSIQDVAVDGLSCKLFDPSERKFASSIQFSGNLLGNILGGGLLLIFYPWLNWQGTFSVLAGMTAITLIQVLLFKEPEAETEAVLNDHKNIYHDIKLFIKQHKHWFLILLIYPFLPTWGFALLNPILVDSGWLLKDIGFVLKVFGSIVGILGAILATPLIAKLGNKKSFISVLMLQAFALFLFILPALGYTDQLTVYFAITIHFICFPALLVISSTICMDNASITSRKATFFTVQFSVASLFGFIYSWLSMAVAGYAGYATTTSIGAVISVALIAVVWFLLTKLSTVKVTT